MTDTTETHPNNDLKSIGLILKKKREELSYTLEHVSEITRITLTCLRHIEEGNMDALPGLVFVRGFIRNYAKLLGLESDWMIEALNQTYQTGRPETKKSEKDYSSFTYDHSSSRPEPEKKGISPSYYLLGAAAIIIIVLSVYLINQKNSEQITMGTSNIETIKPVESLETEVTPEPVIPVMKDEKAMVEQEEETLTPAVVMSPLTLTLVASENNWIRLAIDNQDPFELKLKKDEKYDWPAEEEYSLIMSTGNTATIHLNGEEIIDRENHLDELYQVNLNKFTLKQINNR